VAQDYFLFWLDIISSASYYNNKGLKIKWRKRIMKHVIYIKPGAAGGDGTKNEPIGNIFEAQKKVRELLAAPDTESVTVKIAPGEYNIVSPIEFDSSDSGKPGSPVVWECEGGRALIHASIAVGKGQITRVLPDDPLYSRLPCPEKTLQFDLGKLGVAPEVYSEGCHGFGMAYSGKNPMRDGSDIELFVDGVPFIRARYPNDGFVEVERSSDRESAVFGYSDPRPESWASLEGVRLHGYFYFDWADASVALGELDKENKTITLAEMPHYGIKNGQRYYYYNIPEELDMPGEWYLDASTGRAYFLPPENFGEVRVTVAKHRLLRANGASNIVFRNLAFGYTRADAIDITGGENLIFEGCEIYNIGKKAVLIGHGGNTPFGVLGDGGKNHLFTGCRVHSCGFGGFDIRAGDRNTLEPTGITIERCDIHGCSRIGKTYCFGIALNAVGARVAHNKLHDSPHSVLFFSGNDNIIEYNEVYDVLRESDDASAFYTGRDYTSQGHIIRYNFFHDLASDAHVGVGIFGVYADDNSANVTFYGNVFLNVQSACHLHGGHDITFENNLIVGGRPESKFAVSLSQYWFPGSLKEGGEHIRRLEATPWQNEVWKKKYPKIAEYLSWDPETEQRFPHYARIVNNVIINHKHIDINFDHTNPKYKNTVEGNVWMSVDTAMQTKEHLPELMKMAAEACPGFKELPLDEILG